MSDLQRWELQAPRYAIPHLRLRQIAILVNEVQPHSVFDLGCGLGQLRGLCGEIKYSGCDFVDIPGRDDFEFSQVDLNHENINFGESCYDVVVCSGIVEYVREPRRLFHSVYKSLRPGGRLVVSYFNFYHFSRVVRKLISTGNYLHPDWKNQYSLHDLEKVVASSGVKIDGRYATRHSIHHASGVSAVDMTSVARPVWKAYSKLLSHEFLLVATRPL